MPPRTFTPQQLYAITQGQLDALPAADQRAYTEALIRFWGCRNDDHAIALDYRDNGRDGTVLTPDSGA